MKKLKFKNSKETKRAKKEQNYEIKMMQTCDYNNNNNNTRVLNTTESGINYKMAFKNYNFDISNFDETNLFNYDNTSCCFYDAIDQKFLQKKKKELFNYQFRT